MSTLIGVTLLLLMFSLISAGGLVLTARRVEKLETRLADLEAMLNEPLP